jgi:electron transport complex protein RnfC
MLVGRGDGTAAGAYATVPGRVVKKTEWEDGEGRKCEGLLVRMEGSFDRLGSGTRYEEKPGGVQTKSVLSGWGDLVSRLDECGIVEMEGSGRLLSGVLSQFRGTPGRRSLVVRCVFDDPWLVADRVLCERRLGAVVDGAFLIAEAFDGLDSVVFAVSSNERKMGDAMLKAAAGRGIPAFMVLTGAKYPQRNVREMQLVLRSYEKKSGNALGSLLFLSPATLAAAHDAVMYRRPVLERYVAVGGSAVRSPMVMNVRIGKRIGDLFRECGGFSSEPFRVVAGSPFLGERVRYLDEPVTRTCGAFVAMLENQAGNGRQRDCISCGECRSVCPVGLDPEEMYKTVKASPARVPRGFAECHGCGCCELVCPSRLPLPRLTAGGGFHG